MKTILVDTTRLGEKSGFGTINDCYSQTLINSIPDDMRFVFMVKEKYMGFLGDAVSYVSVEHLDRDLEKLPFKIDLWHTTDQLYIKRRHMKGMLNLFTIHDLNFLYEKKGIHRLKTLLKLRWRVRHSDCVTVISHFVKEELLRHVNTKTIPIKIIYNGIADNLNISTATPSFVKDNKSFFFTIGQMRRKKNFHVLLPMMKYFPDKELYICGMKHDKNYEAEILNTIKSLHLDNVHLTGGISDADKNWMFAHCDAFLFPSRLEGFGLPVLEAMRFGARVVSSKYTSLPEVCQNHAAYFESYDPKQMAVSVANAIKGWQRNGKAAQEAKEYSQQFTFEKYTHAYVSLYREMLTSHNTLLCSNAGGSVATIEPYLWLHGNNSHC